LGKSVADVPPRQTSESIYCGAVPGCSGLGVDADAYPFTGIYRGSFLSKARQGLYTGVVLTGFQRRQNLKFPESWNIKSEHWDGAESESFKYEIQEGKYTDWDAIEKALGGMEGEDGNEEEFEQAPDWPVEGEWPG
jgi:hypothetical protein